MTNADQNQQYPVGFSQVSIVGTAAKCNIYYHSVATLSRGFSSKKRRKTFK
jgi:hypothetical protein